MGKPATEAAKMSKKEILAMAQRAQADLINYRQRAERDSSELSARVRAESLSSWLPFLDAWAEARNHADELSDSFHSLDSKLQSVLDELGVEIHHPEGERFDPQYHEAVEVIEGERSGDVIEVLRSGYSIAGKLVRPASVIVSQAD